MSSAACRYSATESPRRAWLRYQSSLSHSACSALDTMRVRDDELEGCALSLRRSKLSEASPKAECMTGSQSSMEPLPVPPLLPLASRSLMRRSPPCAELKRSLPLLPLRER